MTDTIRVRPGHLADSLTFRHNTALRDCTTHGGDDAGQFIEQAPWQLSSGELLLWRVLSWINGGDDLPSLTDLRSGLDAENYAACAAVLRTAVA